MASRRGETFAVGAEQLARLMVVTLEGLVMLFLAEGDEARCRADLAVFAAALTAIATGRVGLGASPDVTR